MEQHRDSGLAIALSTLEVDLESQIRQYRRYRLGYGLPGEAPPAGPQDYLESSEALLKSLNDPPHPVHSTLRFSWGWVLQGVGYGVLAGGIVRLALSLVGPKTASPISPPVQIPPPAQASATPESGFVYLLPQAFPTLQLGVLQPIDAGLPSPVASAPPPPPNPGASPAIPTPTALPPPPALGNVQPLPSLLPNPIPQLSAPVVLPAPPTGRESTEAPLPTLRTVPGPTKSPTPLPTLRTVPGPTKSPAPLPSPTNPLPEPI